MKRAQFLSSKSSDEGRKRISVRQKFEGSKPTDRNAQREATTSHVTKCIIKAFYCLREDALRNFTRSHSLEAQDIRANFFFISFIWIEIRIKLASRHMEENFTSFKKLRN